jgi:hypothetical protein
MERFGSLSARRFACILALAFKWNREHILSKLFQQIVPGVTDEDKRGHSSKNPVGHQQGPFNIDHRRETESDESNCRQSLSAA